jgi:hypothetical protein
MLDNVESGVCVLDRILTISILVRACVRCKAR